MYLELVNNALSTMLLDSIGHYHKSKKQKNALELYLETSERTLRESIRFPSGML